MSQLISFFEGEPVKTKEVAVQQYPIERIEEFDFGNEPVLTRVIYVAHPRESSRLIPFGLYEDLIMMDKFNEALRIVQLLGAYEVTTQTFRGDTSKLRGQLTAGPVSPGIEVSKHGSREVSFQQYGTGGAPRDPHPILWPDEPGFEAARRAVLLNGSREVSITIESRSAYKVDSDIATVLKKAGFRLGVTSEREQLQLLRLIAHFPEDGKTHRPVARDQRTPVQQVAEGEGRPRRAPFGLGRGREARAQ